MGVAILEPARTTGTLIERSVIIGMYAALLMGVARCINISCLAPQIGLPQRVRNCIADQRTLVQIIRSSH
jgi:hypothetical protein